jgi:glycine/D-amino acid oxidase-like deaminating enzyme
MQKDYLIVGGGLAGLFFAHFLEETGKSFTIIDSDEENTASKVAAGMFGPLGGQLSKLAWKAPEMIEALVHTARNIEKTVGENFLHLMPIEVAFGSVKDANDYACRSKNEIIDQHISDIKPSSKNLIAPHGSFEMMKGGWLNTNHFRQIYSGYLAKKKCFETHLLDYSHLVQTETGWRYQNQIFSKVVFAEGVGALQNPYLKDVLPFKLCKGQVLTIFCEGLAEDRIVKKGVYLVPLGEQIFKAGATYEWDEINDLANEGGKQELLQKIEALINLPFTVLNQKAGIRPTTKDRNPIIGKLKSYEGLYVLNGLGTKGVVRGPWLAKTLFDYIEYNLAIPTEVSINRIKTY